MTAMPDTQTPWQQLLGPVRSDLLGPSPASLATLADALGALARRRGAVPCLPSPVDPAWTMLLALFVADGRCERFSVSDLCAVSGAPLTTAFRTVLRLQDLHMIVRMPDAQDHRRSLVALTGNTRAAMIEALDALLASLR